MHGLLTNINKNSGKKIKFGPPPPGPLGPIFSFFYFFFENFRRRSVRVLKLHRGFIFIIFYFLDVKAGVPQGSRLGPLLFLIYMNDITDDIESDILIFADDTSLFATGTDPAETAEILNRDLQKITNWASTWKVTFNASKTKDIIFSNKYLNNSPPLLFNNIYIERTNLHKHLGIYLSSSLDWSKQVHEVCLKANRKLSVLRSVKMLSRQILDLLYKITIVTAQPQP